MNICGKTISEVTEAFKIHFTDLVEQPTFKDYPVDFLCKIVRMWYKSEHYVWRDERYTVKDNVFWCIVDKRTNIIRTWKPTLKSARIYLGVPTVKKVVERKIRDTDVADWDNQICRDGKASGDKGWCGIRAFANVAHVTYSEARELCKKYGWSNSGMRTSKLKELLIDQGFMIERRTDEVRKKAKTIKTFDRVGFKGKWLIHVDGHFASSVNGVVTDWTAERNHRIKNAWQIH